MKNAILTLLIVLLSFSVKAQEQTISIGINTGIGATIERSQINYENYYAPLFPGTYKVTTITSGVHVPVSIPVMYGRGKWRIGLNISYEYIDLLTQKRNPDLLANSPYPIHLIYQKYHLFKGGLIFQYDLWSKGKHTIGITSGLGYYTYVKKDFPDYAHAPYLYGNVGLNCSYALPVKGLVLTYGIDLNVQGNNWQFQVIDNNGTGVETVKSHNVYFQPRLTIGIRKDFSLSSKAKK